MEDKAVSVNNLDKKACEDILSKLKEGLKEGESLILVYTDKEDSVACAIEGALSEIMASIYGLLNGIETGTGIPKRELISMLKEADDDASKGVEIRLGKDGVNIFVEGGPDELMVSLSFAVTVMAHHLGVSPDEALKTIGDYIKKNIKAKE